MKPSIVVASMRPELGPACQPLSRPQTETATLDTVQYISSPNHPAPYDGNLACQWHLTAPENMVRSHCMKVNCMNG